eukprot:COSAG05_NODE_1979_length_3756_cov_7.971561_2_plen_91_part_00
MRALWIIFKRTRGILLTSTAVNIPTFCQLTSSNQGHLIGIQGNHSNFSTRSRHNIKWRASRRSRRKCSATYNHNLARREVATYAANPAPK